MKIVAKYNLCKGVSTLMSVGTPIITLLATSGTFLKTPETTVSFAGVIALLFSALFMKDKLAENWKVPSTFIVASIFFICCILLENIISSIKWISFITMCTSGLDEITFKRKYKLFEAQMPDIAKYHKVAGFIFTTSNTLEQEKDNG